MARVERLNKVDKTGRYYRCPVCGHGEVRVDNSVFYGRCDECNATIIDYEPAPHQVDFHMSTSPYRLLIGGFGSGKTTAMCAEDVMHVITTPHARLLIAAMTLQQVREAVLPELDKFLPPWLLVGGRATGNPPSYELINGSQILIYASDQEDKFRSLNLTAFHIEEASGVKFSILTQLQSRLRNPAAVIYDDDGREVGNKFMGNLSTNPEDGWIKDEFLLKSGKISGSASVDINLYQALMAKDRVAQYESFISASFDNPYLPKGTIERISAGRDERWKRKYLYSILDSKEGLVYSHIHEHYVEPFPIPDDWQRIAGYDPGIGDPTACLIGAIDPNTKTIYFYFDYEVADMPVGFHGKQLLPQIKPYKFLYPIQADPSIKQRSKETGRTYKAYFNQVTGIMLKEANNDLLYGITKVQDYLYAGKIKFFNNMENFKLEARQYSYPKVKENGQTRNKPEDKFNHLMDALRYAISPLPLNPGEFTATVTTRDSALKGYSAFKQTESRQLNRSEKSSTFVRNWR